MDEYFMQLYTNPLGNNPDIYYRTLNHFKHALSPHVAAALDRQGGYNKKQKLLSDQELINDLLHEIHAFKQSAINTSSASSSSNKSSSASSSTASNQLFTVVETAGGVLSPGPNKTLQADLYRPLRLPVLLVGDAKLGGISTTLSAYESLMIRGYTVVALVMIDQPNSHLMGNADYIKEQLVSRYSSGQHNHNHLHSRSSHGDSSNSWQISNVPAIISFSSLPPQKSQLLHNWFQDNERSFTELFQHIQRDVHREHCDAAEMFVEGQQSIWWPFTQHGNINPVSVESTGSSDGSSDGDSDHNSIIYPTDSRSSNNSRHVSSGKMMSNDVTFIESSFNDYYRTITMGPSFPLNSPSTISSDSISTSSMKVTAKGIVDLFDGCGSWWTQSIGHGNSLMALAIASAAGRYGHVMFPKNVHPPAVILAR